MSTNAKTGEMAPTDQTTNQPEENLSVTAYDPTFSSLDFDRDHGAEVEAAVRELASHSDSMRHAA